MIREGGRFEVMAELPLSEGFLWLPDGGGEPELWLDPRRKGYRGIFESFARRRLGAPGLAGADVHIDHLFPKKAGALNGLAYVRMQAAPPESNMAAGRTVEREMAARAALVPGRRRGRHATYVTIGKATGFAGWESLPDSRDAGANADAVRALFAHLRGFGVPQSILSGLDMQLTAHTLTRIR
jgi:hypothetical protein